MTIEAVDNCYSCHGCESICPKHAISFSVDKYGIERPCVDLKDCINCSLCAKHCENKLVEPTFKQKAYILEAKSESLLLSSSSGGAFSVIVKYFYENGGFVVYGAAYDKNCEVCHEPAYTYSECAKFRKSKYTQSFIGESFPQIKKYLEKGEKVLFSGTPCQVHGLKKFLARDYENLFTIDLLCTGVLSPIIFKSYLEKYSWKIENFDWRNKHRLPNGEWTIMDGSIMINGKEKVTKEARYLKRLYGAHYGYKKGCYSCQFSSSVRFSDLTLGDYWGRKSYFKNEPNKGTSAIIVNSEKGAFLCNGLKDEAYVSEIEIGKIKGQNPALSHPCKKPKDNDMFLEVLLNEGIDSVFEKFAKQSFLDELRFTLSMYAPFSLKKALRRFQFKS